MEELVPDLTIIIMIMVEVVQVEVVMLEIQD
jgi:hypothetical protein